MKNFKFLMPVMTFVMAVGFAFANKANVESNGWVERNGSSYQLQNDPCDMDPEELCKVVFEDDPNTIHQVYVDQGLTIPKDGGNGSFYVISN